MPKYAVAEEPGKPVAEHFRLTPMPGARQKGSERFRRDRERADPLSPQCSVHVGGDRRTERPGQGRLDRVGGLADREGPGHTHQALRQPCFIEEASRRHRFRSLDRLFPDRDRGRRLRLSRGSEGPRAPSGATRQCAEER